jgi:hypothetical protein
MPDITEKKPLLTKKEKYLVYVIGGLAIALVLLGSVLFVPELSNAWLFAIIVTLGAMVVWLSVKPKETIVDAYKMINMVADKEFVENNNVLDTTDHNAQVMRVGNTNNHLVHFINEMLTFEVTPTFIFGKLRSDLFRVRRSIENSEIAKAFILQKQQEILQLENLEKRGFDVTRMLQELKGNVTTE